jgi:hypothetical protein
VMSLMWSLVSVRSVTVLVSEQDRCMVYAKSTIGSVIILDTPDGTPSRRGSSGSSFSVCLEIVLILLQDSCTVCVECTIGSKIILDVPDGTPRNVGHVKSCFGPFGDGVSVSAR